MKPIVTVGICVRNCESSIKEAMNSIFDQDVPHECMEVIFVDDGSEDETMRIILDSVSRTDIQTKVYHNEWKGLGLARNVVVHNASGDYIIWVDGDMTLSKDHVRKQVEFMERKPAVGIAKGRYGMYCGANLVAALENIDFVIDSVRHVGKVTSKPLGTGGSIYRVKAIRQVGGFDDRLKGAGEDIDAEFRIREAGWRLRMTDAVFFERRKETWKALWNQYSWYGHGTYFLRRKNRGIIALYRMLPPLSFLSGLNRSFQAYKLTRQKRVFLLPFQYVLKTTAWCLGFAKSHINCYRHASKVKGSAVELRGKGVGMTKLDPRRQWD